jgi:hypothetical protein
MFLPVSAVPLHNTRKIHRKGAKNAKKGKI